MSFAKGVLRPSVAEDTNLNLNQWRTYIAVLSVQTDSGNATNAAIVMIRTGERGNIIAETTIARLQGDPAKVQNKNYTTFSASSSGTLVVTAELANIRYLIIGT